jgi:hypothetical protein
MVHARHLVEQGAGEMLWVADAARGVGQRSGLGLGCGDELVQRPERPIAADRENVRHQGHETNRRQIALRIVG